MRLAVFDCDGTLVDGQADVCWAMERAFTRAGLPAPDNQAVRRIVGLSLPAAVRSLAPALSEDQNRAVTEFYRASFRARREEGLLDEPLYDGIADLLRDLHASGWSLAVATGKSDRGLAACLAAGDLDVAVCAAAVADWKVTRPAGAKIKKKAGAPPPPLELSPNPDILATLSKPGPRRPALVVGFAAETENLVANAIDKRGRKGCDWIVANDVSPATGTFGGERNTVHLISNAGVEDWPTLSKDEVANRLAARIALHLARPRSAEAAE